MKTNYTKLIALLMAITLPLAAQTVEPEKNPEVLKLETFRVTGKLEEFSDIAVLTKTPVSFTEVTKTTMTDTLASRDIPFALQNAPSFFVTNTGGGAGDARLSVRGFNQRNVSIMINGVPTNDIENGWLYWSNWDGLGDATSIIQLQRGMSAVTLPTQSIGGTLNIITDPTAAKLGGSAKFEVGSDGFFKQSYVLNTGLLKDRFALTVAYNQKEGSGFVRGTWTDAQGYYLGASFKANENHKFELYAIAAPQLHGQNSFQQSLATLDAGLARKYGFTDAQLAAYPEVGARHNQQYGGVSPSYVGRQYYWNGTHVRHVSNAINQTENYYNKPQINLNWYATLSDSLNLATVVYYSGGRGGGSGTLGSFPNSVKYPEFVPVGVAPYSWDRVIEANRAASRKDANGEYSSAGILRNSVNNQDQYGAIAKLTYTRGDWIFTGGVDWRTAKLDHYREVRDLLGGDYFAPSTQQWKYYYNEATNTSTPVATGVKLHLGDKVDYNNTNEVNWLGEFVQAQYSKGPWSAFGVASYSQISFDYENHFVLNPDGATRKISTPTADGYQFKGGVQYAINKQVSVYGNAGYVSKLPIFDAALIDDDPGRRVSDPSNENFYSFEAGLRYKSTDGKITGNLGAYHTKWNGRVTTFNTENTNPPTITYLRGVDSQYTGIELEAAYRPTNWVRFDLSTSFGNWYYTADGYGEIYNATTEATLQAATLSIKGLKVGDAPQSQAAFGVTFTPVRGFSANFVGLWADRYWANYTAENRTNDYNQPWRIPSFTKFDLHLNYTLPKFYKNTDFAFFLHVLNVFDEVYVQDATDDWFNSSSTTSSRYAPPGSTPHSAQRAEVFLGTPRTFTAGVKVSF